MKDRILQILENEQLTSSRFADIINVQRSSISHILSGRNNPSLEVVQKILLSFKNLNMEWVLFGTGEMYKDRNAPPQYASETLISEENKYEKQNTEQNKIAFSSVNPPVDKFHQSEITDINKVENKETEKLVPENKVNRNIETVTVKSAEKIIILNADKTFTEYNRS